MSDRHLIGIKDLTPCHLRHHALRILRKIAANVKVNMPPRVDTVKLPGIVLWPSVMYPMIDVQTSLKSHILLWRSSIRMV